MTIKKFFLGKSKDPGSDTESDPGSFSGHSFASFPEFLIFAAVSPDRIIFARMAE